MLIAVEDICLLVESFPDQRGNRPPYVFLSRKVTVAQGCACVANAANDMRDVPQRTFMRVRSAIE